ncbi:hypothetical protein SAMN02745181_0531 [Rubritalea squalenifaciens DSM 18772]|uniref:Phage major capsid protein E n=2 Tax=Rubritalea TaxID=361050 RepID=A0A1M6CPA5_9BACT|nr:phage capsid protein [Rubritalea squalenifaciens]SHI62789.1 hypothetical protein SAMN02745181_0531 [Rubritalea squalenifaciens DSM 18772]
MFTFSTATELVQHYQPQLPTMWNSLLQQTHNRLKEGVTIVPMSGKVKLIDQIQPTEFVEKTGRMEKTELDEMDMAKRAVYAKEFHKAIGFDEFDEIKLNNQTLPVPETMKELQSAYERKSEEIIIDGVLGTNYEGEQGVTAIELPTEQTIPLDFHYDGTTSNIGLSFDKFARLRRLAMENEAFGKGIKNGSDRLVLATNAAGIEDLYQDVYVHHKEYVTAVEAVRNGDIDSFLGVQILRTEQLPQRTVSSDLVTDCVAWVKSRVCYCPRNNYSVKMSVRDDLSEAIQIRAKFAAGATRLEEKGVWKLPCLVTA